MDCKRGAFHCNAACTRSLVLSLLLHNSPKDEADEEEAHLENDHAYKEEKSAAFQLLDFQWQEGKFDTFGKQDPG